MVRVKKVCYHGENIMIGKLINLANYLDESGFKKEADNVDLIIKIAGMLDDAVRKNPELEEGIRGLHAGVRPGHFRWALEELVDGNATPEELIPLLNRFQKIRNNLERGDLYQYPAINILQKAIKAHGQTDVEIRKEKREKRYRESDVVYNSDKFKVIWPKTEFASCEWTGNSTKWCISAKEPDNMYSSYSKDNIFLYFVLNKELPEDDPFKRISLPTKGDMGILRSEVRDAVDDHIGVGGAMESIGKEYRAIEQKILEHAKTIEFTDDISEDIKSAARKIKNKEKINVKELADILKVMEGSNTKDTYWIALVADSLSSHPNLAETLMKSSSFSKSIFKSSLEFKLDRLSSAVPFYRKALSELSGFGLDIYIIENYDVSNSTKLDSLKRFFNEDASALMVIFPKILKILLEFQEGREAIFEFITVDLLSSEIESAMANVDNETLSYLFNSQEISSRDKGAMEQIGEMLKDRDVISIMEFNERIGDWESEYSHEHYDEEPF